jgi:hypothetical protein
MKPASVFTAADSGSSERATRICARASSNRCIAVK